MEVFNALNDIPRAYKGAAIVIGNFDALHLGHQEIIKTCITIAKKNRIKSGLITFYPHPLQVLIKDKPYYYINSQEQKLKLLKDLGLDFIYIINFDLSFSELSAEEFVQSFLYDKFSPQHIVTGSNFNFGKARKGNAQLLQQYSHLFTYHATALIKFKDLIISTSLIKQHLQHGRIISANAMLGRTLAYEGTVIKGQNLATSLLKVPTANLNTDFSNHFLPLRGVYLIKTIIKGTLYYGVANLGVKPTINTLNIPSLEVHIFDFDQNIYNTKLTVNLLCLIRPERTFNDTVALKTQVHNDVRLAKYVVKNLAHFHLYAE